MTSVNDQASVEPAGPRYVPAGWRSILANEVAQPYFAALTAFLTQERVDHTVYPPRGQVFHALELTPYDRTTVLLLGQDPYFNAPQAHGYHPTKPWRMGDGDRNGSHAACDR